MSHQSTLGGAGSHQSPGSPDRYAMPPCSSWTVISRSSLVQDKQGLPTVPLGHRNMSMRSKDFSQSPSGLLGSPVFPFWLFFEFIPKSQICGSNSHSAPLPLSWLAFTEVELILLSWNLGGISVIKVIQLVLHMHTHIVYLSQQQLRPQVQGLTVCPAQGSGWGSYSLSIARPLLLLAQDVSPGAGDKAPEMCVLNHSGALGFSF